MVNRRSSAVCVLVAMAVLLATPALAVLGDGEGARSRSGGSRATSIDGQFRDDLVSDGNLTLSGDAEVIDGELTLNRTVWRDEFNRFQLGPDWQTVSGVPRITSGMLRTNASDIANASARRAVGMHDLELQFELAPGLLVADGPVIRLTATPPFGLWFKYTHSTKKVSIGYNNETGSHVLITSDMTLMTDTFYLGTIVVDGDAISMSLNGPPIMTVHPNEWMFAFLELTSLPRESAAWENVTLKKLEATGSAVTDEVMLPLDTYWSLLGLDKVSSQGMTLDIALLNGSDSRPIPGLDDITSTLLTLSQKGTPAYVDPVLVHSVRLEVNLAGKGADLPSLRYWFIKWEGDAPVWERQIPLVTVDEDTPRQDLLDLRGYFKDRFTPKDELKFTIVEVSDALKVNPVVVGHNLSVELPTRNWFGQVTYKVRCSDGTLSTDSNMATIEVRPVNDPPLVRPISTQLVMEDVPHTLDITDKLEDIDTPVGSLMVNALSTHVTVEGHVLTFLYTTGNITEKVLIEVSDGTSTVATNITVVVEERDDPSTIASIPEVLVNEDESRWVELGQYLSDEDTPVADIVLSVPDGGTNVTISGHRANLNFTEGGGVFTYVLVAFDGTTYVEGTLRVRVIDVNDPPHVLKVGNATVGDGAVEISIDEGTTADFPITTFDDEGGTVTLTLLSDWSAATLEGATLRIVAPIGGLGVKTIQIIASDGGLAATVHINVNVTNRNDPPQGITIVSPKDNTTFKTDSNITLKGTATDPDVQYGQVLTFTWYLDDDTLLGTGQERTVTNLSKGVHTITLEVSDGIEKVSRTVRINVEATDGGNGGNGGNGGGGGGGGGDDDGGGISAALLGGIGAVVAVVVVLALVLVMRSRKAPSAPARPAPPHERPSEAPAAQAKGAGSEYESLYGAPAPEVAKAEETSSDDFGTVKTYEELYGEKK